MPSIAPCSCTYVVLVLCLVTGSFAGDPYVFFDWTVSYLTASPLGIKQQVLLLIQSTHACIV
jgi:hypothetical protein